MAEPGVDTLVWPIMLELAACLKAEYDETMSEVAIVSGEFIPVDLGEECSQVSGFVQLTTGYPSEGNFPAQEPAAQQCGTVLAFQLFAGVTRCGPEMNADGTVDTAAYNLYTERQLADLAAVKRAIQCCFAGKFDDMLYAIIEWTPIELSGGVGGGRWQVIVQELMA